MCQTQYFLEDICANCGGTRGLHNAQNQRCPKDINASKDHTEYRNTVFAVPIPPKEMITEKSSILNQLKELCVKWAYNQEAAYAENYKAVENFVIELTAYDYQKRVDSWMKVCFGEEIRMDKIERNHRFFEEATELVQATGMTKSECLQLIDYTFDRNIGEINQEVGGVLVTLSALCSALGLQMNEAGETELKRIWTKVDAIRAKQAAKPKHSPLPAPKEQPAINTDAKR